jgi:UDP-N-acetyl-D-glucosamine dehydrogenase
MSESASIPDPARQLIDKLESRRATVAVVGLGYVGLPVARAMLDAGFAVIGYDVDAAKIAKLHRGEPYIRHLGDAVFSRLAGSDRFTPTHEPGDLASADAVVLCVPTPLGDDGEPDLGCVENSTRMVAGVLKAGALVCLESTSYPRTTREVCQPIIESARGWTCGRDFFLAFSPEREDPGRAGYTTATIPRLVGGVNEPSTRAACALYRAAVKEVIAVESAEIAESAKLLENIYRAVNIALVNELKGVLGAMGIDIWRVIEASATKPFGFQPFSPGPGLGGHCIPIDPFYLTYKARQYGVESRFIELAGRINSAMPDMVVRRVLDEIGPDHRGASVLVCGVSYKKNIDDIRETPAAKIITLLQQAGVAVDYHDPHFPAFPPMRKYAINLASVELTPERLAGTDCALVVTDHDAIDWAMIGRHARLIVDTRNVMADVQGVRARVVKA